MAKAKAERSYGLSSEDVKSLAEAYKAEKRFPNPHNKGCYKFSVDALVALGVNKWHPLKTVAAEFAKIAGAEWIKAFKGKETRNEESGKDHSERFIQNLQVLQRPDYGLKILEVGKKVLKSKGAVVDMQWDTDGQLQVRLDLNSNKPIKAGRKPTEKAQEQPKAKKASMPKAKAKVAA